MQHESQCPTAQRNAPAPRHPVVRIAQLDLRKIQKPSTPNPRPSLTSRASLPKTSSQARTNTPIGRGPMRADISLPLARPPTTSPRAHMGVVVLPSNKTRQNPTLISTPRPSHPPKPATTCPNPPPLARRRKTNPPHLPFVSSCLRGATPRRPAPHGATPRHKKPHSPPPAQNEPTPL